MSLKGCISFVITSGKQIVKKAISTLLKSDVTTMAKVGAVIGGALITVFLYAKTFRDHLRVMKEEHFPKNASAVDYGLRKSMNSNDRLDELDDLMDDIRENLDIAQKLNKKYADRSAKKSYTKKSYKFRTPEKTELFKNFSKNAKYFTPIIDEINDYSFDMKKFEEDIRNSERDKEDEYLYKNFRYRNGKRDGVPSSEDVSRMNPLDKLNFIFSGQIMDVE